MQKTTLIRYALIAIALIYYPLTAAAGDGPPYDCDGECVRQCIRAHGLAPGAIDKCANKYNELNKLDLPALKLWSWRERCAVDGMRQKGEIVFTQECSELWQIDSKDN
jgi:hypothetical protein